MFNNFELGVLGLAQFWIYTLPIILLACFLIWKLISEGK